MNVDDVLVLHIVFFYLARDGIGYAHWGLEFRRLLFRSVGGKPLARHNPLHMRSITAALAERGSVRRFRDYPRPGIGDTAVSTGHSRNPDPDHCDHPLCTWPCRPIVQEYRDYGGARFFHRSRRRRIRPGPATCCTSKPSCRSAERRVGKAWVSTCTSLRSTYNL